MVRILLMASLVLTGLNAIGQSVNQQSIDAEDIKQIKNVLNDQAVAWSEGNLEKFMEGYWKSDSLMFVGSRGITYGWDKTLANYKRGYPDKAHTGKLDFEVHHVQKVGEGSYFVIGKFMLTRELGDANGFFTLLWKKINGEWKVVVDHT